ncbi:iron complex outermembrane recepter protein [Mucilaginibacter mallensis]|uniref:Iron complex outermembrane recepter protein n=1 Tax=Mucilaginibacter mallensis TaxID=652787 RepID=A0A1H1MMG6_MUCMA|nr:TonB-dependent receptor [Mucilaginibacter mallensis]SDR87896.1 iron complex outermembrane recepter protein [Mucilaginibacter mallensis]
MQLFIRKKQVPALSRLLLSFIILFTAYGASAQSILKGKISDPQGAPLVGATIKTDESGGTSSDANGAYSAKVTNGKHKLTFSFTGFETIVLQINIAGADTTINVTLNPSSGNTLKEVVISTGIRTKPRTITDSPVPIDIVGGKDLASTGQPSFDKALEYRVPSFNTVNTPVNDATSLLDPYEIRNLGPSRTLILIDGKRKNPSALTYIVPSPGRGEGGADLSAIPIDAIDHIEILRDGASAQYGSDAIAGVLNVILKKKSNYGAITLNSGITGKGDGGRLGVSLTNGVILNNDGYINYTLDLSHIGKADRPGIVSAIGEANSSTGFGADINVVNAYLAKYPTANNHNADPEKTAGKFLINGGIPLDENSQVYFNAAYVAKKVNSFANFRTPYWQSTDYGLLHAAGTEYIGYGPTFEGDLSDYNGTIGIKSQKNGWNTDVSFTTGGNQQLYTVNNTINNSLGVNSPISFKTGGFSFSNNIGNIDISRKVTDQLNIAFGSEFRVERWQLIPGDTASYSGGGAQSFPGYQAKNAIIANRYNLGGYFSLDYDVTHDFLVSGTIRDEQYSDFGNTFVWKLSSRYKLLDDKLTLRGSASTGFKAPSLAQLYEQLSTPAVSGGTVITQGLVNNISPQAKAIGIPELKPEKSLNLTAGVGVNPVDNLNITLDYYNIKITDRIILSNTIGPGTGPGAAGLDSVLSKNHIAKVIFFTNGLDTRTQGLDFVASYRNILLGSGRLGLNVSGNYTLENKNLGTINPPLIEAAGASVINANFEALLLTSRPKFKYILGADYRIGKWSFNANETIFGPTTFHDTDNELNPNLNVVFKTKGVTDIGFNFDILKNLTFSGGVENLFNVLPKWHFVAPNAAGQAVLADPAQVLYNTNGITFNGRYPVTTNNGSQFSQLGIIYSASLKLKF